MSCSFHSSGYNTGMKYTALFFLACLVFSCFRLPYSPASQKIDQRLAASRRIVSSKFGEGMRTHLWIPFQKDGENVSFEKPPQVSVTVIGKGKTPAGKIFLIPIKTEKIKSETNGFSLTVLSTDFPDGEISYMDVNYLAMLDCQGDACISPPCGDCCLQ